MMDEGLKGPSMPLEAFLRWHELPAKVQVTSGYSAPDDEEDSLSSGEIIDLHGVTIGEVVLSVDNRNQRQTLPVHQKRWFEILSDQPQWDDQIFESVGDLLAADPRPKQIRVLESVDTGDELSTLYVEDILNLVRVNTDSLVVTNQLLEEITLPSDLKCKFTPQLDQKWYTMQDIVAYKLGDFPMRVRLTGTESGSARRGTTYLLEDVRQEANVLAQVNKELVAIPLDIDVTVALVDGRMLAQSKACIASTSKTSLSTIASMKDTGDTISVRKFGDKGGDDVTSLFGVENPAYFKYEDDNEAQRIMAETYGELQNKNAECLRLEADVKALRARYDRQLKQMNKLHEDLNLSRRQNDFWYQRYSKLAPVTDDLLKSMVEFCENPIYDEEEDCVKSVRNSAAAKMKLLREENAARKTAGRQAAITNRTMAMESET